MTRREAERGKAERAVVKAAMNGWNYAVHHRWARNGNIPQRFLIALDDACYKLGRLSAQSRRGR